MSEPPHSSEGSLQFLPLEFQLASPSLRQLSHKLNAQIIQFVLAVIQDYFIVVFQLTKLVALQHL